MLKFSVDVETCISCGQCASDCPAMIIQMQENLPVIPQELEQYCIECMHCAAICSENSVSILGCGLDSGIELKGASIAAPKGVEMLIKSRRSTRNYQDRDADPKVIDALVEVASHAPSGHNDRALLYTLVDEKSVLFELREQVYDKLDKMVEAGELPDGMEMFADIVIAWKEGKKDILFRNAPHLLIVSADQESSAPLHDSVIALTTFELYASSHGLGTIWNGLLTLVLSDILPTLRDELKIPQDHEIGYAMGFGHPAIWYKRTVDRGTPAVNRVSL